MTVRAGGSADAPKVVGIGGGHGLAATLRAARRFADDIVAVVTVADDGGSSGRLTRELGIPAVGDIRNCLAALARDSALADVFQHRYTSGPLTGHTIGNLVIAGLTERNGDFAAAVEAAGDLVDAVGRVYPATTQVVRLGAEVEGGIVTGQVAVARTSQPIHSIHLDPPDPVAHEPAVRAILEADLIVLGPGSLFTSLLATLLVPGIGRAVVETSARRVLVCNSREQKGETEGLDAADHLEAITAHVGQRIVDVAIANHPVLEGDGVPVDEERLRLAGVEVVRADVAHLDGGHDPLRLADALVRLGK